MLSEPLSLTYDGVSKSFVRVSYGNPNGSSPAIFVTADLEFSLEISETRQDQSTFYKVKLERIEQDADSNPFTGSWSALPNSFAMEFGVNQLRYNTATDLGLLQSALLAFVDSTVRDRITAGEK